MTAEEELRASKGKGKMAEPADVDDDEEDEEDFDENVRQKLMVSQLTALRNV